MKRFNKELLIFYLTPPIRTKDTVCFAAVLELINRKYFLQSWI